MNKYVRSAVALLSTLMVQPCFAYWQITFSGGTSLPAGPPSAAWSVKSGNIYSATNNEVYGPVSATINWVGPDPAPSSVTCIEESTAGQQLYNPPPGPVGSDVDSTMYWWIGNGLGTHVINQGPSSPYTWVGVADGTRTTVHTSWPFTVTVNPYAVITSHISPYPTDPLYHTGVSYSYCAYKITLI